MSSGKELTTASDDPFATSRALGLRNEVAQNQQFQRNVDEAASWQSAADAALGNMGDLVLRARDLLVQGATGTTSDAGRRDIATEITQLIDALKAEGNAEYAGRYIFAGSATLTAPYQQGANDTFAGNGETLKREIGPGTQIDLNQTGQAVLGDQNGGLLSTLRSIVTHLQSGDTASLGGTDLRALDTAHDGLLSARAVVGATTNRLDTAKGRLQQLQETATKLLSETEDADMAKTLVDFSMQQAVYQSALKAGANLIQPSLMDFLR
jgi:flagellar hook-associated protein 3 FlgL